MTPGFADPTSQAAISRRCETTCGLMEDGDPALNDLAAVFDAARRGERLPAIEVAGLLDVSLANMARPSRGGLPVVFVTGFPEFLGSRERRARPSQRNRWISRRSKANTACARGADR